MQERRSSGVQELQELQEVRSCRRSGVARVAGSQEACSQKPEAVKSEKWVMEFDCERV